MHHRVCKIRWLGEGFTKWMREIVGQSLVQRQSKQRKRTCKTATLTDDIWERAVGNVRLSLFALCVLKMCQIISLVRRDMERRDTESRRGGWWEEQTGTNTVNYGQRETAIDRLRDRSTDRWLSGFVHLIIWVQHACKLTLKPVTSPWWMPCFSVVYCLSQSGSLRFQLFITCAVQNNVLHFKQIPFFGLCNELRAASCAWC